MARGRVCVVLGFLIASTVAGIGPLRAAGSCSELYEGPYLVGADILPSQYSGRVNGSRANLTAQDPALCDSGTTNRYSLAWVGMTNFSDGLIQIGYWKHRTPAGTLVLRFFAEWFLCGPSPQCDHQQEWKTLDVGTLTDGSTYNYRLLRDVGGTNKVNMMVCTPGTNTCQTVMTADDPYGGSGWGSAARVLQSGETQNLYSDLPGTDNQRADFANMQAFIGDQGSWQGYDFSFCAYRATVNCDQGPPYRYHETWKNNPPRDHLEIWTDPT